MSTQSPVSPAPEVVSAEIVKPKARPPYVAVPAITDPKLTNIPEAEQFLALCDGEKTAKSWRVRVRRPKFPVWVLLASLVPLPFTFMYVWSKYDRARRIYASDYLYHTYESKSNETTKKNDYDPHRGYRPSYSKEGESLPQDSFRDSRPFSPDGSFNERVPLETPPLELEKGSIESVPEPKLDAEPEPKLPVAEPPFLDGPGFDDRPKQARQRLPLTLAATESKPRPPSFGWFNLFFLVLLWSILPLLVVALFVLFRFRGHTFLYLTNKRLILVELEQSFLRRRQTVLNFSLENIAGFTLHAQRGLRRLLNLILLKEKRTFYMAIVTRTQAQFALGAINTRRSQYDPGLDAVALCAELDALVLGLKASAPPK